jgi:hypothetical protein
MVRLIKRKIAGAVKAERPIEPLAFSIAEFALLHGISQDHYFRLARAGLGPKIMKIGARTLVSAESAAEWRAQRERATEQRQPAAEAGLLRAPGSFPQS